MGVPFGIDGRVRFLPNNSSYFKSNVYDSRVEREGQNWKVSPDTDGSGLLFFVGAKLLLHLENTEGGIPDEPCAMQQDFDSIRGILKEEQVIVIRQVLNIRSLYAPNFPGLPHPRFQSVYGRPDTMVGSYQGLGF